MDICVQWTQKDPGDYVTVPLAEWENTAKKTDPKRGDFAEVMDNDPGLVMCLCVHGTRYRNYDHYAIIPLISRSLDQPIFKVVMWQDDSEDFTPGWFQARETTYWPIQPDPALGGALNTRAKIKVYCGAAKMAEMENRPNGLNVQYHTFHPYSEFIPPADQFVRHGKWVSDAEYDRHTEVRNSPSWREWGPDGYVPEQRPLGKFKPLDSTRTYFQRDTALATTVHVGTDENEALLGAGAGETESEQTSAGNDELSFIFNTPIDEPDNGSWPTGLYRCKFDVALIDVDFTFGCLTIGGSAGHFGRVNSALSSEVDSHAQTQGAFAEPAGLKLASFDSTASAWTGSTQSDRFEVLVAQGFTGAHGNGAMTLTFDSDAFIDGVWTAAGAAGAMLRQPPLKPFLHNLVR